MKAPTTNTNSPLPTSQPSGGSGLDFDFPINVCNGCLVRFPPEAILENGQCVADAEELEMVHRNQLRLLRLRHLEPRKRLPQVIHEGRPLVLRDPEGNEFCLLR